MQELIDRLIELSMKSLWGEGERFIRYQALTALLKILQGIRKILLLQYVLIIACFLWAMSFFASGYILASQYTLGAVFELTPVLRFSLGTLVIIMVILYLAIREKTWVQVSGLKRQLDELQRAPLITPVSTSSEPKASLTREEISQLLEQMLEKKLAERSECQ